MFKKEIKLSGAYILAIIFFTSIFLLLISCDSTEPKDEGGENKPDTTNHDITWQTFTFGGESEGSYLFDVAIIDENNIWAVGEIHIADERYNAVHWDGTEWKLKKIMFNIDPDQTEAGKIPSTCQSIFYFLSNELIITSNVQLAKINSEDEYSLFKQGFGWEERFTVNSIWGLSSNDFYVVGNGGNIAHYNKSNWEKIESGTDVTLRDVWGSPDGSIIWAAGFDDSYGTILLRNSENGFEKVLEITDPGMPHPQDKITHVFKSLWTDKLDTVYLGAIGRVYAAPKYTAGSFAPAKENIWWDYENETEYPPETNIIRGTGGNDIFVGGYLQFVKHYNGKSWQRYREIEGDGTWRGMAVGNNIVVVVGESFEFFGRALIAIGYRTTL